MKYEPDECYVVVCRDTGGSYIIDDGAIYVGPDAQQEAEAARDVFVARESADAEVLTLAQHLQHHLVDF